MRRKNDSNPFPLGLQYQTCIQILCYHVDMVDRPVITQPIETLKTLLGFSDCDCFHTTVNVYIVVPKTEYRFWKGDILLRYLNKVKNSALKILQFNSILFYLYSPFHNSVVSWLLICNLLNCSLNINIHIYTY